MAKVKLQKIRITGMKKHYKILMQELHRQGVLEVVESEAFLSQSNKKVESHFGDFDLARITFALDFLAPYEAKKSKLASMLSGGKLILTETEAKERLEAFSPESESVIEACEKLEEKRVRAQNELAKIPEKEALLRHLSSLGTTIRSDYTTARTKTWVGKVTVTEEEAFAAAIATESNLVDIQILDRDKKSAYFRVTAFESFITKTQTTLHAFNAEVFELKSSLEDFLETDPEVALSSILRQKVDLEARLEKYEIKAKELAKNLDDLRILFDYNAWRKTKNDLQHKIFLSESVFAFEAWMPKGAYSTLEKWIKHVFVGEVAIEKIRKEADESTPVLLENAPGIDSFESVTEMYDMPGNKDTDPTRFVALFFPFFFGLCLSDVGYGSILFLVASLFLMFGTFEKEVKKMLWMLVICGGAAIIGGVALGGYFGIDPEHAPAFLLNEAGQFRGQILNPTGEPIRLLILALSLGVMQILVGLAIAFFVKIKRKKYIDAFADHGVWFAFLVSVMVFGTASFTGIDKGMALMALEGIVILLVLTQGRSQKNWIMKFLLGLYAVYDGITSYLSNVLSYARLMALAIATGVVALVMNTIGLMIYDMIPSPIVGFIAATFIILFGHALNFALSLLGAFIHTARLQFIEFFDKFYTGGGKKFTPFKRVKKYLFFKG